MSAIIIIIIAALLLFGPNKLPDLGRAVGRTFREFKEATRDIVSDDDEPQMKKVEAAPVKPVEQAQTQPAERRLPE
ncbi:twin-arginine translocase TatA/TatE family subunit [Paenibacillus sp. J22TS3]|uniref:twin-arginine translocase TatA/TatE family subunit n=1 Tax=Paenibacillus sp. J22TS3 TaxID=2807192 RepID=UPI001B1753E6|nr:twin-arginine translocase TatA/TatE family subunit [Paenibacillus sp. J22TS3]GIP22682.1 protein translocase TatA [Paenibacillus sp. J22TS3]